MMDRVREVLLRLARSLVRVLHVTSHQMLEVKEVSYAGGSYRQDTYLTATNGRRFRGVLGHEGNSSREVKLSRGTTRLGGLVTGPKVNKILECATTYSGEALCRIGSHFCAFIFPVQWTTLQILCVQLLPREA